MNRWRRIFGVVLAVAVLSGEQVALAVPAATSTSSAPSNGSPGQGLEISPPVMELAADPGQTLTATIYVRNVTQGVLIAKGKADDFGPGNDESGEPKLLLDETGATRYSLKYWVSGVPDVTLAPQERKTTTIKISVPTNAEPGGHFGVVRFTAVPPDLQGTGVALSASIGALILLKVSGAITEKVSVAEFASGHQASQDVFKAQSFFQYGPVDFLVRVTNEGSVHEKVQGTITIKDWLGHKVKVLKVNEKGGNVLPTSIRRFEQSWSERRLFGYYTADLALTYSTGKKLDGKTGFWVIPWMLILLVLVGAVVFGVLLRLGIRRYNDHIIAAARRRR